VGEEAADPVEGRSDPAASTLAERGGRVGHDRRLRVRRHKELRVGRLGGEGGGGGVPTDRGARCSEGAMGGSGARGQGRRGCRGGRGAILCFSGSLPHGDKCIEVVRLNLKKCIDIALYIFDTHSDT
jgi:hypothetical protein